MSGQTVDRVKVEDVNDNETRYVSNTRALLGKVEIEQGGDDNETAFAYDASQNLTRIADEAGNETQYAYTAFNELSKVARANTTINDPTAQYVYDAAGNMTCAVDAKRQVVSFEYDTLNRLTKKHYWDGSSCETPGTELRKVEVSYAGSRLAEVKETRIAGSKALSKLSYDYDESFRLASVREAVMTDVTAGTTVGRTMEYDYNARDQVALVTPSSGDSLAYTYYDDGSMNEVRLAGTRVAKYEYDAQRMRSKVTRYQSGGSSTATTTDYTYDYQDRLTAIEHKDATPSRITKYEYGYNDGSNGKGLRT
jgi:YD repeat-containing protein